MSWIKRLLYGLLLGITSIAPGIMTATVILTVLPALTMIVAGVVVLVKRKTRQSRA